MYLRGLPTKVQSFLFSFADRTHILTRGKWQARLPLMMEEQKAPWRSLWHSNPYAPELYRKYDDILHLSMLDFEAQRPRKQS